MRRSIVLVLLALLAVAASAGVTRECTSANPVGLADSESITVSHAACVAPARCMPYPFYNGTAPSGKFQNTFETASGCTATFVWKPRTTGTVAPTGWDLQACCVTITMDEM